jgi:Tfp pilus assembly protein PilF
MTPRGFPAPGGAPLQYTKAHIRNPLEKLAESSLAEVSRVSGLTDTFGLSKSKNPWTVRPARPFTHESHGRANEIFEDGIYNMSDRRDVKLAEKHFREVLKFDPDHVGALSYLGIIEQEYNQNYIAAEDLFIRALALEPNNATVLGAYAQLHQNCACNYDEAEKCFKKAIACDLFDANIHANYGIFLRCALG